MADECPICTEPLIGTLATLGCCKKIIHVECLVKCMKQKLDCPMCRARHENLRLVQDVESQVLVPVAVQYNNNNFFRNFFAIVLTSAVIIVSIYH